MVTTIHPVSVACELPARMGAGGSIGSHIGRIVTMGHGGGGRLMHRLLEQSIFPLYRDRTYGAADAADLNWPGAERLAFSTDSYVVQPLFFPGGNIGKLAVCGTVNDLAMVGARPRCLSLSLIIGEGFLESDLDRVLQSVGQTAAEAGVEIVTGDTKVVESAGEPQLFINTAGIGVIEHRLSIHPQSVRVGDVLIVSGDIGRHSVAVLSSRDGTALDVGVQSDCGLLHEPVLKALDDHRDIHCLRDLTRGGLATALIEIAQTCGLNLEVDELSLPVSSEVRAYAEISGLDPLYFANEGRFLAVVPERESEAFCLLIGPHARKIGSVQPRADHPQVGSVVLRSPWGSLRTLTMLSGEQLPRIC
jgi:hydrogenase expression/formation protein HypE